MLPAVPGLYYQKDGETNLMIRYALRRCAYSILIMFGVLVLTFLLFRVAAGDPAATVLGKNPSPEELENMRMQLGSDKPLFFGDWRRTEAYPGADFSGARSRLPGITPSDGAEPGRKGLLLPPGASILVRRNFQLPDRKLRLRLKTDTPAFRINGEAAAFRGGFAEFILHDFPEEIRIENGGTGNAILESLEFMRPTANFFDSQLTASLFELVSFQKEFPYVSFFNFGETLLTRTPIKEVLWSGMWASLMLMLPIFFGELIVGIALAMLSAIFRGRWIDRCIMLLSVAGMSISYLALILFCQWLLGYYLNLFPVWGWDDPRNLALPVIVGIISGTGSGVRFYRTVFLNEMNREYLRTAIAKGCPPFQVYFKHLLKNAAIPIITRASTVLPFLFTGSLLLESFFGIPGLGFRGVDALNSSDLQTLKALVILGAFLFVFINLLTDLAYAWVDPRVRPR